MLASSEVTDSADKEDVKREPEEGFFFGERNVTGDGGRDCECDFERERDRELELEGVFVGLDFDAALLAESGRDEETGGVGGRSWTGGGVREGGRGKARRRGFDGCRCIPNVRERDSVEAD